MARAPPPPPAPPPHLRIAEVDDEEVHVRLEALVRHGVAQEEGEQRRRAQRPCARLQRRDHDARDVVHQVVDLCDEEAAADDGLEQREGDVLAHSEVEVRAHDDEEGLRRSEGARGVRGAAPLALEQ